MLEKLYEIAGQAKSSIEEWIENVLKGFVEGIDGYEIGCSDK